MTESNGMTGEVDLVLFYGQSNAGPGGESASVLTEPMFADSVFSFATRKQLYGNAEARFSDLSGVGPVSDHPKYPPLPATATAFALGASLKGHADVARKFFFFTVWEGGQPLSAFVKGKIPWNNLMGGILKGANELRKRGLHASVRAMFFVQGEGGPWGREAYRNAFTPFSAAIGEAIKLEIGQAEVPKIILLQINKNAARAENATNVELAQWDVAQAINNVVLAGPMYQMPLGDNIHQNAVGRMMQGDLLAYAYRQVVLNEQNFEPLHPTGAIRNGSAIVVKFKRPPGSGPLMLDADWVAPCDDFGFAYADDARSTKIADVSIYSQDEVLITLNAEPTGANPIILYGQGQNLAPGWSSGRGQLYCSSSEVSSFVEHQPGYPQYIRHYCLRSSTRVH